MRTYNVLPSVSFKKKLITFPPFGSFFHFFCLNVTLNQLFQRLRLLKQYNCYIPKSFIPFVFLFAYPCWKEFYFFFLKGFFHLYILPKITDKLFWWFCLTKIKNGGKFLGWITFQEIYFYACIMQENGKIKKKKLFIFFSLVLKLIPLDLTKR